ncbi:hypothetical protein [Reichenbachiella sp.]
MPKYTPEEILAKYPELQAKLNWRKQDIGIFLRCKLVRGSYDSKRRVTVIDERSLVELMEFANDNLDKQKVDI